jgi:hypothetical protein
MYFLDYLEIAGTNCCENEYKKKDYDTRKKKNSKKYDYCLN